MKAVVYDAHGEVPVVRELPDPVPDPAGAVIRVEATGVCRSDWHAWMGHDQVPLPHVGGHEFAGVVTAVGPLVGGWQPGQRVTAPFVCACGTCEECASGNQQVCERQTQPGFTYGGSFAEYVAIDHADVNLVLLPDALDFVTASALGCRFGTAFRAVLRQGRVAAGEWVAVHGCGGAGLSAVMIAAAAGARVVAVDIAPAALELAREFGAVATVDASVDGDPAAVVRDLTGGGAHVSLDCLGLPDTCAASVSSLRRRGRHVQVGLMPLGPAPVPMDRVIAFELELLGSHGLQAYEYPTMLGMVESGLLRPDLLVRQRIGLDGIPAALVAMGSPSRAPGITVAVTG
ncbi:zinc-dependent alcohol dehydrogenase family protein [Actinopolymorpha alba]|uniref:zinc-dependent alcohol dehydrogenase family protein n=1 Tax=Actinopolymorpha alba TaxID=533267 RepID=UPI00035C7F69|nr:zinc-dependent alcohol dehydrogenase family protein [Actinopolymorpha alba]